jgi:pimeloyl-ACP methyl ester carboxylesterase
MHRLQQHVFGPAGEGAGLQDEPLVIHCRPQAPPNRTLILLIHGLGGSRYDYWGEMPTFLYSDFPAADLGLYSYDTALKRIRLWWKSLNLEDEARVLANVLRQLVDYSSVVLIGHSMGGLLAKGAIAHLVQVNDRKTLRRLTALVLLASPQAGSLRVPSWFRIFSPDARSLYPHNTYIQRTDHLLRTRINPNAAARPDKPFNVPTWAVVAANDFWVDPMSAGLGLPDAQQRFVRGDHGTIIRPAHREAGSYQFIRDCIAASSRPAPARGRHTEGIVCEPAEIRDAPAIHQLAVQMFGTVSPCEVIRDMIAGRRAVVRVVRRMREDKVQRWERFVGYFVIMPLTPEAADQIRSGQMLGSSLTNDHMTERPGDASTLYLGSIAASDFYSKAVVLEALRGEVYRCTAERPRELLARPVRDEGLRLVTENGFRPVNGTGGMGTMYRLQMGDQRPTRQRRKGGSRQRARTANQESTAATGS